MNKAMAMIRVLLVGFGCVVLIAMWCIIETKKQVKIIRIPDPNYVQNIGEAQRRLKAQGLYDGPIDYKWGPKMEKAYCDYCAIQTFKDYKENIEKIARKEQ